MVHESKFHIVAVSAMVRKDGKYLIMKRSEREIAFPGKWQAPGGKVEPNETLEEAVQREVLEEGGVKIKNIRYMRSYDFMRPDGHHVVGIAFVCEWESGEVKISKAHTDFAWATPEEAKKYDMIPRLWETQFKIADEFF